MMFGNAEFGAGMDIVVWLRSLGLGKYEAVFRENEIDETVLPNLTAEDLKELGVTALGHRRKLLDAIAALRTDTSQQGPSAHAASPPGSPSASPEDRAERRQVTVMFSDLVGSAALSARTEPFTARALATFRNKFWRDIRRARNQFWSSFKYATTHDLDEGSYNKLMSGFNDLQNDHALLVGWYDLMLASKKLPIEAQVFQFWYFALYPEKLGSEADVLRYETLFPGLRDLSRSDQKEALRNAIEHSRQDPAIMNDPATEQGYLIKRGD
jgi:SAM domain (Sterile alpha motif)